MKRYTGMKATEVREAGGLSAVVKAFARRLAALCVSGLLLSGQAFPAV